MAVPSPMCKQSILLRPQTARQAVHPIPPNSPHAIPARVGNLRASGNGGSALSTSPKPRYDTVPFALLKVVSKNVDPQNLFGIYLLKLLPLHRSGSHCPCARRKRAAPSRGTQE